MPMLFAPSEFQQVKYFVCLSAGNKLCIPDAESKSVATLQLLISSAESHIGQALAEFLCAYDRWYEVRADIDCAESAGEHAEFARLAQQRDRTRNNLITTLSKVGAR
jgi:hypothetical protein